jgi:hypothetical protein
MERSLRTERTRRSAPVRPSPGVNDGAPKRPDRQNIPCIPQELDLWARCRQPVDRSCPSSALRSTRRDPATYWRLWLSFSTM